MQKNWSGWCTVCLILCWKTHSKTLRWYQLKLISVTCRLFIYNIRQSYDTLSAYSNESPSLLFFFALNDRFILATGSTYMMQSHFTLLYLQQHGYIMLFFWLEFAIWDWKCTFLFHIPCSMLINPWEPFVKSADSLNWSLLCYKVSCRADHGSELNAKLFQTESSVKSEKTTQ